MVRFNLEVVHTVDFNEHHQRHLRTSSGYIRSKSSTQKQFENKFRFRRCKAGLSRMCGADEEITWRKMPTVSGNAGGVCSRAKWNCFVISSVTKFYLFSWFYCFN